MFILNVFKFSHLLLSTVGGMFLTQEVQFESLESKTLKGEDIFNKVSLNKTKEKDTWSMKQSHNGFHTKDWDNIQIVVHKDMSPPKVSYHQLKNGKEVEYKASCYRCHPSGPRLIRPNYDSKTKSLDFKEKLTILNWNLLIKSYGNIQLKENNPFLRNKPLGNKTELSKKHLEIGSCTKCHDGEIRSKLTLIQKGSTEFLVKKKMMPPWPYSITKKDKRYLKRFINDF